jgi:uncharacterized membrane protein
MPRTRIDPWFFACVLMCLLAFAWMEWLALNHWMAGRWYLADVGNIQFALFNTLHGRFMWSPMVETNHYAYHFTPLLTALAPITLLSVYPIPLITVYLVALSCCPLALFRITRNAGASGPVALSLGFLFLSNHFTGSVQLSYHFETLLVLFVLCIIALGNSSRPVAFWCSVTLALFVKEDAAAWCAAFAVYCLVVPSHMPGARARKLLVLSLVAGVVAGFVIWAVGHSGTANASFYIERAGHFGFSWSAARSFLLLIASTGGLCLLGGNSMVLALLPGILLLSSYPFTRELLYYYSYPFLPFLFLATALGAARLERQLVRKTSPVAAMAIVCGWMILCGLIQLFLPTRVDGYIRTTVPVRARDELRLRAAREVLPADAPTAIQFGLWGLTPNRQQAWQLKAANIQPDRWIFADLKSPYGMATAEYVEIMRSVMDEVTSGSRKLLFSRDDIFVVGPRANSGVGQR